MVDDRILENYLKKMCQYSQHKGADYVDCLTSVIMCCMKDQSCMDDLELLFANVGMTLGLDASLVRHGVNMCVAQICFQSKLEYLREFILGDDDVKFVSTETFLRGMVSYLCLQQSLDQKKLQLR